MFTDMVGYSALALKASPATGSVAVTFALNPQRTASVKGASGSRTSISITPRTVSAVAR